MPKTITLLVPDNDVSPDCMVSFTPEENSLLLKIGCGCIMEGRKALSTFSQEDIYKRVKEETRIEVTKLEWQLSVEKELAKKMEVKIGNIYAGQVDQLKKQIDSLQVQLRGYESDNREKIQKEVDRVRERCDLLLQEKENQNKMNRLAIEKLQESVIKLTNQGKSNSLKGSEGEREFSEYAETFMDFKSFQIEDKHTQGGQGDFHLHFEEFDILVDAKNYRKKVPVDQREKIKNDLLKNEHIHFAWLVSLNTSIDKWDKAPIMYEWVNAGQCIVYVNNLSGYEDPRKILRIVWFTCRELFKLVQDINTDVSELSELKNKQFRMADKVREIRKNIRELNTSINSTKSIVQLMDEQLREIVESESTVIVSSHFSVMDEWWHQNVDTSDKDAVTVSTDVWLRFRQDNKVLVKEMEITVEKFKQYIKSKVPFCQLMTKSKNANSAFDIRGIRLNAPLPSKEDGITVEIEFPDNFHQVPKKIIRKKQVCPKTTQGPDLP